VTSKNNASPLKTSSASRDQSDVTKAKKSRFHSNGSVEEDDEVGCGGEQHGTRRSSRNRHAFDGGDRGNNMNGKPVVVKAEGSMDDDEENDSEYESGASKEDDNGGMYKNVSTVSLARIGGSKRHYSACSSTSSGRGRGGNHHDGDGGSRSESRGSISSGTSGGPDENSKRIPFEPETNPDVLARRQKQLEYGKNTSEYHNYIQAIPK
jgi:hypothetical protein